MDAKAPTKHADVITEGILSLDGPHRGLCRQLLRLSMAAVITCVIGYCFSVSSIIALVIAALVVNINPLVVAPSMICLGSVIALTTAGHPVVNNLERRFPLALLRLVRTRAIITLAFSVLGVLITTVCFIVPAVILQHQSQGYYDESLGYWVDGDYDWRMSWFLGVMIVYGPICYAYYIPVIVICSLLVRAAGRAVAAVASPQLIESGAERSSEVNGTDYNPVQKDLAPLHASVV